MKGFPYQRSDLVREAIAEQDTARRQHLGAEVAMAFGDLRAAVRFQRRSRLASSTARGYLFALLGVKSEDMS